MILFKKNNQTCFDATIENNVFILESETGQYYWFNETASILWNSLEKPKSLQQLASILFNLNPDLTFLTIEYHIKQWIKEAIKKNLIYLSTENAEHTTLNFLSAEDNRYINPINFIPPKTHSLDCNNIQGTASSFNTDNFQTGS